MNIAIVFHGLSYAFSEKGFFTNYKECIKSIEKNVISCNVSINFCIYFHTWNHNKFAELKETFLKLENKYNNCTFIQGVFENTKDFSKEIELINNKSLYISINEKTSYNVEKKLCSILSKNYSAKKALSLIESKYEWILLSRFDIIFQTPLNLQMLSNNFDYYVSKWNYDYDKIDKSDHIKSDCDGFEVENLYLNQVMSKGLVDYFVLISKSNVKEFSKLYDNIPIYLKQESEYEQNCITTKNFSNGWPQKLSGHPLLYWHTREKRIGYINVIDIDVILERDIEKTYKKLKNLIEMNEYEKAIIHYNKNISDEIKQTNFSLHLTMCLMYYKNVNNIEKAIEHSWKSLCIHKNLNALINLGIMYENKNDIDKCLYFFKEALLSFPEHPNAILLQSKIKNIMI